MILHRSIHHRNYKLIIIDNYFFGDVSDMINSDIFTICYHTAITHDIRGRREKLKENWRQGLSSVISVEVAGIPYWTEIKFYEIKSKISPSHLML